MGWRRLTAGLLASGILALTGVAGYAAAPRSESAADTRQRLVLPPAQRNEILAEMRQMLGSLRGILYGLAGNDMRMVENAAQVSGVGGAALPQLGKQLPEEFLKFRRQTHEGFNRLADKAKSGGNREAIIKELAALSNNCVGCHNAYRVVEGR